MKKILFLITMIFLAANVTATFSVGIPSHSIDKAYAPLDNLRGWINMSISGERGDSLFIFSDGNSISLLDLFNNSAVVYSCNPKNCQNDYTPKNSSVFKKINLQSQEILTLGMLLYGELSENGIISFSAKIESNATESCKNQINIDFLGDGKYDLQNKKASFFSCSSSKNYGCFDESKTYIQSKLSVTPYCQKVSIQPAPAYEMGVLLKRVGSIKPVLLRMYDLQGNEMASCELQSKTSSGENEEFCTAEYFSEKYQNVYICVSSPDGDSEYSIRGYADSETGCGFRDFPNGNNKYLASYSIFSEAKKYNKTGILEIPEEWTSGYNYNNYIKLKYGSFNCTGGCILPIKIIAEQPQSLVISDINLQYELKLFGSQTEKNISELNVKEVVVSTDGFQKISLDNAGFLIPGEFGEKDLSLSFIGTKIFSEIIKVMNVPSPLSINPSLVTAGIPAKIFAFIPGGEWNITSYEWNFGDNESETTSSNYAVHTYKKTGGFILKLTATDITGVRGSKMFNITAESPENSINKTLQKKISDLEYVKKQIQNDFSQFEGGSISSALEIDKSEKKLKEIQTVYAKTSSGNNETYLQLIKEITELDIPEEILITKEAKDIPFYIKNENVDYGIFEEVERPENYSGENFANIVAGWNRQNLDTKINFKEVSGRNEYGEESKIANLFEINFKYKKDNSDNALFFMRSMDDLKFDGDYSRNLTDYVYFPLGKMSQIFFTTTEDIDFTNIPAFITPGPEELGIGGQSIPENKNGRWIWFVIIIAGILGISLFVYYILQNWYKRKYESHLFPKRNDLYNLAAFIENAKKNNQSDSEIANRLRKSGWNHEQTTYALKKYAGKRTGMREIPFIGKNFEKKSIQKNVNFTTGKSPNIYKK